MKLAHIQEKLGKSPMNQVIRTIGQVEAERILDLSASFPFVGFYQIDQFSSQF
jgi:hypothetical protein